MCVYTDSEGCITCLVIPIHIQGLHSAGQSHALVPGLHKSCHERFKCRLEKKYFFS